MTDNYSSLIEGVHIVCIADDQDDITERQEMASRLGQLVTGLMNESGMMHSDPEDVKKILSLPGSSHYVESTAGSIEQVHLSVSTAIELLEKRDLNYRRANGLLVNLSLDRFPKPSQVKQLVDAVDSHFDRLATTVLFNVFEDSSPKNQIRLGMVLTGVVTY